MVSINYSAREVCCKIVYYGPGLSGKTTNLQYIHSKVPQDTRGKLISLATEADRTLYFDFLPINIGTINDFQAKFQLYTVPGQVYYNATRKLVLRGVDGLVFVADSQPDKMDENIESLANLEENLREYGYDPDTLPLVLQYNKVDLPGVMSIDQMNAQLNTKNRPYFTASATLGQGVFDTLKLIIKLVLEKAKSTSASAMTNRSATAPAPSPAPEPKATPYPEVQRVAAEENLPAPPAETPEPPEPVGVAAASPTAPSESHASEQAAVPQEAPTVDAVAQPQSPQPSAARPYPGTRDGGAARKTTPTGYGGSASELTADSLSKNISSTAETTGGETGGMTSPQMAPSLKRRGNAKKRGFFKRLFGIK